MTLTIGWWAVPAFITLFACYVAVTEAPDAGQYGFGAFIALVQLGAALIVSLVAWLIWSLFA